MRTKLFWDMKTFNILIVIFLMGSTNFLMAQTSAEYDKFGASFEKTNTVNGTGEVYKGLKVTDTTNTQITGKIREVCQAKGCWMKVDLADGNEVFVKFKDYGFFVPTDAAEKTVVMNGQAFIEEMSVDEQRHYAEDEGLPKSEIEKITKPKKTLRFEADGVLIAQ